MQLDHAVTAAPAGAVRHVDVAIEPRELDAQDAARMRRIFEDGVAVAQAAIEGENDVP
jgi:hypothetical protein